MVGFGYEEIETGKHDAGPDYENPESPAPGGVLVYETTY